MDSGSSCSDSKLQTPISAYQPRRSLSNALCDPLNGPCPHLPKPEFAHSHNASSGRRQSSHPPLVLATAVFSPLDWTHWTTRGEMRDFGFNGTVVQSVRSCDRWTLDSRQFLPTGARRAYSLHTRGFVCAPRCADPFCHATAATMATAESWHRHGPVPICEPHSEL